GGTTTVWKGPLDELTRPPSFGPDDRGCVLGHRPPLQPQHQHGADRLRGQHAAPGPTDPDLPRRLDPDPRRVL
ncbi:MAG: hypothetical protein AVDCRST_MAG61-526, partial [uncultured Friedmanniella sp.]